MTEENEKLLARALKEYPVGCQARSVFDNNVYTITQPCTMYKSGEIACNISIYDNQKNKWAEIISLPEGYKVPEEINNDYLQF